jgi:transcription antitermination factor NusG
VNGTQKMYTSTPAAFVPGEMQGNLAAYQEPRWFAAYVTARHEKQVAIQLERRGIQYFLPVYRSVRRWKDRRKELELPLFPSYIFVNIAMKDRLQVQCVPSVLQFVSFHGMPAELPESDMENMRNGLSRAAVAEPHPFLKVGRRVRVHSGAMRGIEGILVRIKDTFRVVITIELIQRSVAMEVDEADIEPIF